MIVIHSSLHVLRCHLSNFFVPCKQTTDYWSDQPGLCMNRLPWFEHLPLQSVSLCCSTQTVKLVSQHVWQQPLLYKYKSEHLAEASGGFSVHHCESQSPFTLLFNAFQLYQSTRLSLFSRKLQSFPWNSGINSLKTVAPSKICIKLYSLVNISLQSL